MKKWINNHITVEQHEGEWYDLGLSEKVFRFPKDSRAGGYDIACKHCVFDTERDGLEALLEEAEGIQMYTQSRLDECADEIEDRGDDMRDRAKDEPPA